MESLANVLLSFYAIVIIIIVDRFRRFVIKRRKPPVSQLENDVAEPLIIS